MLRAAADKRQSSFLLANDVTTTRGSLNATGKDASMHVRMCGAQDVERLSSSTHVRIPRSSGHPAMERLRPLMRTARARIRIAASMHRGVRRAFRKLGECAAPPL